jgi:hypothetical protein
VGENALADASAIGALAFAVGKNASAFAQSPAAVAVALGEGSDARATDPGNPFKVALAAGRNSVSTASGGSFNVAAALGESAQAQAANGTGNLALVLGARSIARAGLIPDPGVEPSSGNIAVVVGRDSTARAYAGNVLRAVTIGSNSDTVAGGGPLRSTRATATTIGNGSSNTAYGDRVVSRIRGNNVRGGANYQPQ